MPGIQAPQCQLFRQFSARISRFALLVSDESFDRMRQTRGSSLRYEGHRGSELTLRLHLRTHREGVVGHDADDLVAVFDFLSLATRV